MLGVEPRVEPLELRRGDPKDLLGAHGGHGELAVPEVLPSVVAPVVGQAVASLSIPGAVAQMAAKDGEPARLPVRQLQSSHEVPRQESVRAAISATDGVEVDLVAMQGDAAQSIARGHGVVRLDRAWVGWEIARRPDLDGRRQTDHVHIEVAFVLDRLRHARLALFVPVHVRIDDAGHHVFARRVNHRVGARHRAACRADR